MLVGSHANNSILALAIRVPDVRLTGPITNRTSLDENFAAQGRNRTTDTRIFRTSVGNLWLYFSVRYRSVRCSICSTMQDDA